MLPAFLVVLTLALQAPVPGEPDGAKAIVLVQKDPKPPTWLRGTSHALASVDTKRYLYEVYRGENQWIARYVMLPEGDEAYRELEQAFLFGVEPKSGRPLALKDLVVDEQGLRYKDASFPLVERRELILP